MDYFTIYQNGKQVANIHALNGMYAIIRYCKVVGLAVDFIQYQAIKN